MEVCGTFDLILQGRADMADYTRGMERVRGPLSEYVTRFETSFVARTVDRPASDDESKALWLPCKDGRRRVEYRQIDKIVAEDDYMRVHVGSWSCLLHDTMAHLAKELLPAGFVQLHRSWLVRIDFIDKLIHDQRRWTARLVDGTHVGVAKSHTHDVLRLLAGESPTAGEASANSVRPGDTTTMQGEKLLKLPI